MGRSPKGHAAFVAVLAIVLSGFALAVVAPRASAGAAIVYSEGFETGIMNPRWIISDSNPAGGEDFWGITSFRAHTGTYSAWAAEIGNQSSGSSAGMNNSAPGVQLYDDEMQADLVVDLRVNGYSSLFLSFWYYVKTENGGGDWIQAWYEAGGVQTNIFNPRGSSGNNWEPVNLSVPNNVERLIIRFHTDSANHGFEGAYVDDIVLTGIEDAAPSSSVQPLSTYNRSVPAGIPYDAQDNPNASGVDYVELWYRIGTTGPYTLYTRPANPAGQWEPWLTDSIPFDTTFTGGDGHYEFYTIAVDNASNREAAPVNGTPDASMILDATPPVLTLNAPAQGALLRASYALVAWQATDATSGLDHYETRLDDGAFVTNGVAGSRNVTGLSEGTHRMTIRAYDRAGNFAEDSVTFVVDTVAPNLTIGLPAPGEFVTTDDYTFIWSATDATSGIDHYEVWLDGGVPIVIAEERVVIGGIADGQHTFYVRAFDRAGNVAEASVTFQTDKNPFSLTGPYRGLPLLVLLAVVIALLLLLLLWWKRRKDKEKEEAEVALAGMEPVQPLARNSEKIVEERVDSGPANDGPMTEEPPAGPP